MNQSNTSSINSLEGVNLSGVKPFLLDLAIECKIHLQFIFEEKKLFSHVLDFKIEGEQHDIDYFYNVLDDTLASVQKDNFPKKYYKVASINMVEEPIMQSSLKSLKTHVVTHRFSQIKKLGQFVAEQFDMNLHVTEKKQGFKKNVSFNLKGTDIELEQFKSIFKQFVVNVPESTKKRFKI